MTDLEVGLTFAETARTSRDPRTRIRNIANVRKAFLAIRDVLLPKCNLDDAPPAFAWPYKRNSTNWGAF
jgi:hypothetical protein